MFEKGTNQRGIFFFLVEKWLTQIMNFNNSSTKQDMIGIEISILSIIPKPYESSTFPRGQYIQASPPSDGWRKERRKINVKHYWEMTYIHTFFLFSFPNFVIKKNASMTHGLHLYNLWYRQIVMAGTYFMSRKMLGDQCQKIIAFSI